jgi:hypothetical protein
MTLQRVSVLAVMLLWIIINAQTDPEQTAGFHITDVQAFHAQKCRSFR